MTQTLDNRKSFPFISLRGVGGCDILHQPPSSFATNKNQRNLITHHTKIRRRDCGFHAVIVPDKNTTQAILLLIDLCDNPISLSICV